MQPAVSSSSLPSFQLYSLVLRPHPISLLLGIYNFFLQIQTTSRMDEDPAITDILSSCDLVLLYSALIRARGMEYMYEVIFPPELVLPPQPRPYQPLLLGPKLLLSLQLIRAKYEQSYYLNSWACIKSHYADCTANIARRLWSLHDMWTDDERKAAWLKAKNRCKTLRQGDRPKISPGIFRDIGHWIRHCNPANSTLSAPASLREVTTQRLQSMDQTIPVMDMQFPPSLEEGYLALPDLRRSPRKTPGRSKTSPNPSPRPPPRPIPPSSSVPHSAFRIQHW